MPPRSPRKPPDVPGALGHVGRRGLPEAQQAAWWADLARWVDEIRASYPHLWPDRPEAGRLDPYARTRKRPWPDCWQHHPGLVEDMVALKAWQQGLLGSKDWAGGPRGWCEWRAFLDTFAAEVQIVSQQCDHGHRDTPTSDPPRAPRRAPAGHAWDGLLALTPDDDEPDGEADG